LKETAAPSAAHLGRGATKLYEAVEAKLTEQRRFVLWWDAQEKDSRSTVPYSGFGCARRRKKGPAWNGREIDWSQTKKMASRYN